MESGRKVLGWNHIMITYKINYGSATYWKMPYYWRMIAFMFMPIPQVIWKILVECQHIGYWSSHRKHQKKLKTTTNNSTLSTKMSFLFGRKPRPNTVDLSKQAKDLILKLDGPGGAAKVYLLRIGKLQVNYGCADDSTGWRAGKGFISDEVHFAGNTRQVLLTQYNLHSLLTTPQK